MKRSWSAVGVAIAMLAAAGCTSISTGETAPTSAEPASTDLSNANPGDCIVVDVAVSPEKIALLTDLARTFNDQRNTVDGTCIFVRPQKKSSGAAAPLLVDGWADTDANGPQPVIWSPAASGWAGIVNQRLADRGQPPIAPASKPFMLTPLVIAMPKPMADALGYPDTADRVRRHRRTGQRPAGLGQVRPPGVGPVPARQDQPQLLDERSQLHDRRVLRRHRQDDGPHDRGPRARRRRAVRHRRRVRRRPLRRHHAHVPQQLVPRRRPRHVADLRLGGGRRGEVGHRLQPRQPRRRARSGRGAAAARRCRSSRSTRRRARSTPTTRSSSSMRRGSPPTSRRRAAAVRATTCSSPRTRAGAAVRVPPGNPRCRRRADHRRQRRRPDPAPGGARGAVARPCSSRSSTRGPSSARRPACCS